MKSQFSYGHKSRGGKSASVAVALGLTAIILAMVVYRPVVRWWSTPKTLLVPAEQPIAALVHDNSDAIELKPEVAKRLGIKTIQAAASSLPQVLELSGTLALDPTRLQEVRSRFAGEITEIGKNADGSRPLQFGDSVKQGQLVTVLWSHDLGETKSQLVELMVQLHMHRLTMDRLKGLSVEGAIPEREFQEAAEKVETDRNDLSRVRRTLQTWRVSDAEIKAVEAEAQRLIQQDGAAASEAPEQWARAEIVAALGGVILEQDVAVGDNVSTDDVLFKIADLSRLRVIANAYEEDLPNLDALPTDQREWQIAPTAIPTAKPVKGSIEQISRVIDPVQHTAAVMGWVDNSSDSLRAGQFVTVKINLPALDNEIAIPSSAVVEQGGESLVFVQRDADPVFERRRVSVARQVGDSACVHITPPEGNDQKLQGIEVGETVVVSGVVELQQVLTDLQAEAAHADSSTEAAP